MKILLLDQNLFGATRVESNLQKSGHTVLVRSGVEEGDFDLIIWNFGNPRWTPENIAAAVAAVREKFPTAKTMGFCGHREVDKWRAAQSAGVRMASNDAMLGEASAEIQK